MPASITPGLVRGTRAGGFEDMMPCKRWGLTLNDSFCSRATQSKPYFSLSHLHLGCELTSRKFSKKCTPISHGASLEFPTNSSEICRQTWPNLMRSMYRNEFAFECRKVVDPIRRRRNPTFFKCITGIIQAYHKMCSHQLIRIDSMITPGRSPRAQVKT